MTLEEIREKKLTCVVHTKSEAEAKVLAEYFPWKYWGRKPSEWWSSYAEQTGYYIENGELLKFSLIDFYKDRYPHYGEVYEFSELFPIGSTMVCDDIKKTEEKKMATKFTFYVTEGTRIDKSCNKTVPTMTTFITADAYGDGTYHGTATCDKADYDVRQGCLEALANAVLGGNFDREFNRAVKANEFADKKKRTCTYCGKVFDTVEEKEAEEAWHVERKRARRERYLLRKRAKEIAFEEQAQKMAKEMINEKE